MNLLDNIEERERGIRLKRLRKLAHLGREAFANAVGVTPATISNWENASLSHLTEKGARKVLDALKERVECTLEWLLYGVGLPPTAKDCQLRTAPTSELLTFFDEMKLFLSNSGAVTVKMYSSAMQPILNAGDIVGGVWHETSIIGTREITGIIEINNHLEIRNVKKCADSNSYDLSYLSYYNELKEPFEIKEVALTKIAPVIRIWRERS